MPQALRTVVLAALAGDLAITLYLIVMNAITAHASLALCLMRLMQWDASNAYGDGAYDGGWGMAGIGQLMDLVVSFVWAGLFAWLWWRFPAVRRHTWLWGLGFGVIVMAVMIYGVVPLGHARQMHNTLRNVVQTLVAHTVFFGLPVALVVSLSSKSEPSVRGT